jgi:hypothetical protein
MLYVLGKETLMAMKNSRVLIVGLRGLGVEVGMFPMLITRGRLSDEEQRKTSSWLV